MGPRRRRLKGTARFSSFWTCRLCFVLYVVHTVLCSQQSVSLYVHMHVVQYFRPTIPYSTTHTFGMYVLPSTATPQGFISNGVYRMTHNSIN